MQKSIVSKIGGFKAGVIVSQHGESYIEINMTDSSGTIFGSYTVNRNREQILVTFEHKLPIYFFVSRQNFTGKCLKIIYQ